MNREQAGIETQRLCS